eukprot:m.930378 g.930378  ORF g.930378 m.930378 type:complete len:94 (-) comp23782_c0_seq51:1705-1986(-)
MLVQERRGKPPVTHPPFAYDIFNYEIPASRTCAEARIPFNYCGCINEAVSKTLKPRKSGGRIVVDRNISFGTTANDDMEQFCGGHGMVRSRKE